MYLMGLFKTHDSNDSKGWSTDRRKLPHVVVETVLRCLNRGASRPAFPKSWLIPKTGKCRGGKGQQLLFDFAPVPSPKVKAFSEVDSALDGRCARERHDLTLGA